MEGWRFGGREGSSVRLRVVSDVAVQVLVANLPPVASPQLSLGSVRAELHPTDQGWDWFWVTSGHCLGTARGTVSPEGEGAISRAVSVMM